MSNTSDAFWRQILQDRGLPDETIDRAASHGPLELIALEEYILGDTPHFDIEEAAALTGIEVGEIGAIWRALGFPDPAPGEPTFIQADLETLASTVGFIERGEVELSVALQMARVIGSSLAHVAAAQAEVAESLQESVSEQGEEAQLESLQRSVELLPMLANVIESVWRRHLAVATRRRLLRDEEEQGESPFTVGFADLEGFTSLSQQLPEKELAEVVNRFEALAYDTVGNVGGRVVKMIGDEVMFMAEDPVTGAELALALADTYAADEALSNVRVGLATGPAFSFEGDLYGPAVNLASRIVSIAYPGTVVVPNEIVEALGDDQRFAFRPLRPHYLRHIGHVRLWVMRRVEDDEAEQEGGTLRRAHDRRATRRAWIADMMSEQLADRAAEAAGDVTERAIRFVVEGKPTRDGDEPGRDEPDGDEPGSDED